MPPRRCHPWYKLHRFFNCLYGVGRVRWFVATVKWLSAVVAAAAFAFLTLLQFCDPTGQDVAPEWLILLRWFYGHRFTIACTLLALMLTFQLLLWLSKLAGRLPAASIEQVLEETNARFFPNQATEDHVYRTTLFKVRGGRFTGLWLGAVARSGHIYKRPKTVFSIDGETKLHNTGVAGECWRQNGKTLIYPKPMEDQRADGLPAEARESYEKAGYLTSEEYDQMSVKSRVFLATGIRVEGKLWGVLVLDSTDPEAIKLPTSEKDAKKRQKEQRETLEFAATFIGLLVKPE